MFLFFYFFTIVGSLSGSNPPSLPSTGQPSLPIPPELSNLINFAKTEAFENFKKQIKASACASLGLPPEKTILFVRRNLPFSEIYEALAKTKKTSPTANQYTTQFSSKFVWLSYQGGQKTYYLTFVGMTHRSKSGSYQYADSLTIPGKDNMIFLFYKDTDAEAGINNRIVIGLSASKPDQLSNLNDEEKKKIDDFMTQFQEPSRTKSIKGKDLAEGALKIADGIAQASVVTDFLSNFIH